MCIRSIQSGSHECVLDVIQSGSHVCVLDPYRVDHMSVY